MPTRESYVEGTPSWTDLSTPDVEGAKAFYRELFGWDYTEEETDSTPYVMALRNGLSAAGIGALPDESMPSVWSTYFAVDDADATAAKIQDAGGSLMMECIDITDAGTGRCIDVQRGYGCSSYCSRTAVETSSSIAPNVGIASRSSPSSYGSMIC